ncbi:MAG: ATP-binding protein [Victivallales bacterium]|nr:ATP-binding protein [Victivallales bacterium]
MDIKRDFYLEKLIARKNDGFVKIITGIRRCGKSYLLNELFREHLLKQGRVRPDNIIQIALDSIENAHLCNPYRLYEYVRSRVKSPRTRYYALIDEIQMCEEVPNGIPGSKGTVTFYDTLNGLMKIPNLDVYVTGSNSKMLSDDVATHFRDRGKVIRLHPLSFSEYLPASGRDALLAFQEYLVYGGMPEAVLLKTPQEKQEYLSGLFETLYVKDIVEHNKLKDDLLLEYLIDVLMSSVGSLTNISRLVDTLKSTQKIQTNPHTLKTFVKYLMQAYLFGKAERFDVKGRKYLAYPSKYYAEDIGLRNARLNYRQTEQTHLLENVIYNELISRGAKIDVGVVEIEHYDDGRREKHLHEIDFVVNLGMGKLYIQSALTLPDKEKRDQETLPLRNTGDSFRKLVVTGDNQPFYTDSDGISYVGIIPFLLDKSILSSLMD